MLGTYIVEEGVLTLSDGDFILMYSDGITEAMNREGDLFGVQRLEEALRAFPVGPLRHFPVTLMRRIKDHRNDAPPNDDLTFIALRKTS